MEFLSDTPGFFRVILQQTKKLDIPATFARRYMNPLPPLVKLKTPNGDIWTAEISKNNDDEGGEFIFEKGWLHFAHHYSLDHGHFLVFEYQGDDTFELVIFDQSATEISYPEEITTSENIGMIQLRIDIGESRASQKAQAFESQNPFFMVLMSRTYLTCSKVYIPVRFADKYFINRSGEVILEVSNGRKKRWSLRYSILEYQPTGRKDAKLCHGWKEFAADNKLEVGDVCVFELIKDTTTDIKFQVTIYRHETKTTTSFSPGKAKKTKVSCSAGASRSSSNPPVTVVLASWKMSCKIVYIPNFFPEYLKEEEQYVMLKSTRGGKSWPVKYVKRANRTGFLSAGWAAFATENHLKPGDECVFELVKTSNGLEFQVSITHRL